MESVAHLIAERVALKKIISSLDELKFCLIADTSDHLIWTPLISATRRVVLDRFLEVTELLAVAERLVDLNQSSQF